MRNLIFSAVAVFILSACGTAPKIYTDFDRSADVTAFQTYGFFEQLGTDREGYRSIASEHLIQAVKREMASRGFKESSNPDLLINFHYVTQERITQTGGPSMGVGVGRGSYGRYRSGYVGWSNYGGDIRQYTEGSLIVDIVDNANDRLVFEGRAVANVTKDMRENPKQYIDTAIEEMFLDFLFYAVP